MTALPAEFLSPPLAHRGLHDAAAGRPENSLAAFRAAVAAGYGIELDVQPSSDGEAMVFHDYTLDRLTAETGPVNALSAAELGRIRLRGTSECIPTLSEVLAAVGGRAAVLVEIKDQEPPRGQGIGPLEAAVALAIAGYAGPVAVMSFNPDAVAEMARLAPGVPRGLTTASYDAPDDALDLSPETVARLRAIADYQRTGSSFISHEAADLGRPRVAELKAAGAAVLCWTVRSAEAEVAARRVADNITFEGYRPAVK